MVSTNILASGGIVLSGFLNSLYPIFIRGSTVDLQFKILLRFVSFFIVTFAYLFIKYLKLTGEEKEKYKTSLQNVYSPNILKISALNYLYVAGIIVAMQYAPQYITFPIFMTWTIVLVLLEKFYFHKDVSKQQFIYVILGFVGILIMNYGEYINDKSTNYNKIFILFAVFSAIAHGVFVPFFKEVSEQTNDPIIDTYYLTGLSSIIAILVVIYRHYFTKNKISLSGKWMEIIKLVLFYVIVEGIANYTYYYGLSKLPAVNTAILYNSMVVFGILVGVFYFKEKPTIIIIVGVLLIIASIVMLQLKGDNHEIHAKHNTKV